MKNLSANDKVWGFFLILLGVCLLYPAWSALYGYSISGLISWDSRKTSALVGAPAAVPHVITMIGGAWLIAYGLSLIFRR